MRSARLPAILAALAAAVAFEALTVLATGDPAVRAVSPWQDDPYDVPVSLAKLVVPPLAALIAARLLVWRAPGGPDREQQTARAAGALAALIGLTLAAQWAAVAAGAHRGAWNAWTGGLIAGLAALSMLTAAAGGALWRRSAVALDRRHDWLEDLGRRWVPAAVVDGVRRHATAVFAAVSVLAGAAVAGAQAVGEGWTDPLLIGWAAAFLAVSAFACCLAANAVAGFVARPTRGRADRVIGAGAAALILTTAFRDPLWTLVASRPVESVPVLVCLTMGAASAASILTAAVLAARQKRAAVLAARQERAAVVAARRKGAAG